MRILPASVLLFFIFCNPILGQKQVKHFIFFAHERERIKETSFLKNENIQGAQLKYTWRELEPRENEYDLALIQKDLDFLNSKGKKLFIQLQDVTFDTQYKAVPRYIMQNKKYNGGADIQYFMGENDSIIKQNGYVARRWDTTVANRFFKLLFVLGQQFDGKIEGINLPETSAGFGETGKLFPKGYTTDIYKSAILSYMGTLRKAFPKSVVIQYANFMPGEWLPYNDRSYLKDIYALAKEKGIGMGGPDIKVYNKGHMNNGYKFLKQYSKDIITGLAVQDGNYELINPQTGKPVTIDEIYELGKNYIGLDYIFWCTEEPFYTKEVLPFLKGSTIGKPKDGTYTFAIAFAEWQGKSNGTTCTVIIKGDSIKVVHNGTGNLTGKKGDILDEGIIMKHKSGKWIIGHNLKDKDAKEIGGCSEGPSVIDFNSKRFWSC